MNRRQKIIVSVTGIFLVLLLLVGLTYAYFLTRITGNTNDKSISVSTANLAIVYGNDDGSVIGSGEKITPGTTFEPKTFTVTNQGNANTDYVVVIEDAGVTYAETIEVDGETQTKDTPTTFKSNDFTYTLKCESGCNSVQEPTTFPIEGGILVGNRLEVGETQTYSFTLTYNETGENQSNDMNKKLEAKINIKDITTINPYSDKPNTLAYNIINNAVVLTNEEKSLGYAELVGAPYTKVAAEKPEMIGTASYEMQGEIKRTVNPTYQERYITFSTEYNLNPDTGKFSLVNPQVCKYNEPNCVSDLVAAGETIYIGKEGVAGTFSSDGTLKPYEELNFVFRLVEAEPASGEDSVYIKFKTITKTAESVISIIPDDYGTSYYYRGAVKNNYVNFNRMCWRIVRIEGDGSVRMILADKDAECSEETLTKTDSSIIAIGSLMYPYDTEFDNQYSYDYIGQPYVDEEGSHDPYDIEYWSENMMHVKKAYNVFLNGGTLEYMENGSEEIIEKEYAGFSEENLDLLKNEKVCIGDSDKTFQYEDGMRYYSLAFKRLYEDKYTSLLCNSGDYTEAYKMFPLTIDEVILAGGMIDQTYSSLSNFNYYLRENTMTDWWLLSYSGNNIENFSTFQPLYFALYDHNITAQVDPFYHKGIRPVVSLMSDVTLTSGNGSITNPYVVG